MAKKKGGDFSASDVTDAISSFNRNISSHHKKVFEGIFKTLETGLSKLGETSGARTKAIRDLIYLIKDIPMDGRQDYDVLGFIYEYLISNFAANAGKKAGEFYTPHEVSLLMSEIVAHHLQDKKWDKNLWPYERFRVFVDQYRKSAARYVGRFSGHRKKIWIRARHTNESKVWAQRQNRIAIPRQSFSCPNIFSIILRFCTASESYLAGEILLHFGGIHVFVPYVEQFCRILSVSYALSASRYFIRKLIPFDNFVSFFGVVHLSACQAKIKWHFFSIFAIMCILVVRPPTLLPTCLCSPSQRMLAAVLCALMVVESIMAILLLPAFAASDVKTSRKAPLLLQRAKRLRIVSNFPYFSGISLHDRPCFVTQLAQLMTTRAQIFQRCWGLAKNFLKPVKLPFRNKGWFPFQYPHREVMVRAWKHPFSN